jgi:hypothetical protein
MNMKHFIRRKPCPVATWFTTNPIRTAAWYWTLGSQTWDSSSERPELWQSRINFMTSWVITAIYISIKLEHTILSIYREMFSSNMAVPVVPVISHTGTLISFVRFRDYVALCPLTTAQNFLGSKKEENSSLIFLRLLQRIIMWLRSTGW